MQEDKAGFGDENFVASHMPKMTALKNAYQIVRRVLRSCPQEASTIAVQQSLLEELLVHVHEYTGEGMLQGTDAAVAEGLYKCYATEASEGFNLQSDEVHVPRASLHQLLQIAASCIKAGTHQTANSVTAAATVAAAGTQAYGFDTDASPCSRSARAPKQGFRLACSEDSFKNAVAHATVHCGIAPRLPPHFSTEQQLDTQLTSIVHAIAALKTRIDIAAAAKRETCLSLLQLHNGIQDFLSRISSLQNMCCRGIAKFDQEYRISRTLQDALPQVESESLEDVHAQLFEKALDLQQSLVHDGNTIHIQDGRLTILIETFFSLKHASHAHALALRGMQSEYLYLSAMLRDLAIHRNAAQDAASLRCSATADKGVSALAQTLQFVQKECQQLHHGLRAVDRASQRLRSIVVSLGAQLRSGKRGSCAVQGLAQRLEDAHQQITSIQAELSFVQEHPGRTVQEFGARCGKAFAASMSCMRQEIQDRLQDQCHQVWVAEQVRASETTRSESEQNPREGTEKGFSVLDGFHQPDVGSSVALHARLYGKALRLRASLQKQSGMVFKLLGRLDQEKNLLHVAERHAVNSTSRFMFFREAHVAKTRPAGVIFDTDVSSGDGIITAGLHQNMAQQKAGQEKHSDDSSLPAHLGLQGLYTTQNTNNCSKYLAQRRDVEDRLRTENTAFQEVECAPDLALHAVDMHGKSGKGLRGVQDRDDLMFQTVTKLRSDLVELEGQHKAPPKIPANVSHTIATANFRETVYNVSAAAATSTRNIQVLHAMCQEQAAAHAKQFAVEMQHRTRFIRGLAGYGSTNDATTREQSAYAQLTRRLTTTQQRVLLAGIKSQKMAMNIRNLEGRQQDETMELAAHCKHLEEMHASANCVPQLEQELRKEKGIMEEHKSREAILQESLAATYQEAERRAQDHAKQCNRLSHNATVSEKEAFSELVHFEQSEKQAETEKVFLSQEGKLLALRGGEMQQTLQDQISRHEGRRLEMVQELEARHEAVMQQRHGWAAEQHSWETERKSLEQQALVVNRQLKELGVMSSSSGSSSGSSSSNGSINRSSQKPAVCQMSSNMVSVSPGHTELLSTEASLPDAVCTLSSPGHNLPTLPGSAIASLPPPPLLPVQEKVDGPPKKIARTCPAHEGDMVDGEVRSKPVRETNSFHAPQEWRSCFSGAERIREDAEHVGRLQCSSDGRLLSESEHAVKVENILMSESECIETDTDRQRFTGGFQCQQAPNEVELQEDKRHMSNLQQEHTSLTTQP